jgi:hypothetical protein
MNALRNLPDASLVARLHELYHDASKHSVYQSVPSFVARVLGYQEEIHSLWRSDTPRYDYLVARLDLPRESFVADIGANTGFFTLNLANAHPDWRIAAYEANPRHAEFIRLTANAFGRPRVEAYSQSCDLDGLRSLPEFDAVLLLNVLHHAGFDFDPTVADSNEAFTAFARVYLERLRAHSRRLVFQIGSNRGGDKARPLFHRDDDLARLAWTERLLRESGWGIDHLGYAELDSAGAVKFHDAPDDVMSAVRTAAVNTPRVATFFARANLSRFPGEFHRRPLIIASALH